MWCRPIVLEAQFLWFQQDGDTLNPKGKVHINMPNTPHEMKNIIEEINKITQDI